MQDTIERELTVKAPKERVFNAIADPTQITAWFPDSVEGSLEVGQNPILDFGTDGKTQIHVVANQPYDYFAYRWVPINADKTSGFVGDILSRPNTLVEFRLQEGPEGTTVKLTESGFASLPAELQEKSIANNNEGWDYMFDRLKKYFD